MVIRPGEVYQANSKTQNKIMVKSFHCTECREEVSITQRASVTVTFQHRMNTYDVEIFICTGCYMSGGLSKAREREIIEELSDAQDGARW